MRFSDQNKSLTKNRKLNNLRQYFAIIIPQSAAILIYLMDTYFGMKRKEINFCDSEKHQTYQSNLIKIKTRK